MVYVLTNQIRFDFEKYGPESIIKESTFYVEFMGDGNDRVEYKVSQTELALQDLAFNLDEVTEMQDSSVFRLARGRAVKDFYT